jgi:ABC-2 type transport system permease protein
MRAMISAELLRLRTVATHRWIALGLLALIAVTAAPFVNSAATTSDEVVAQLRGLAQLAMVMVAAYAAHIVGDEFRRGSVAMTYLVHPSRGLVAAAHAVTYAAVGAVLAALLAAPRWPSSSPSPPAITSTPASPPPTSFSYSPAQPSAAPSSGRPVR